MEEKDALFTLVKSLSRNEKRYFKICTKHVNKPTRYLELYAYLDEQEVYDPEKLREYFADHPDLASLRNYLSEAILRSLREYSRVNDIRGQITLELLNIDVLCERGMYKEAKYKSTLTKNQIKKYDLTTLMLELLERERRIICYHLNKNWQKALAHNCQERRRYAKQLENEIEVSSLYDAFYAVVNNTRQGIDTDTATLYTRLLEFENADLSFDGKRLWLSAMGLYLKISGNSTKAASYYQKQIALWEAYPGRIKLDNKLYKRILANYANQIFGENNAEFFAVLKRLKTMQDAANNPLQGAEDFQNIYLLELRYYMNKADFDEADKFVPQLSVKLDKYRQYLHVNRLSTFYYNLIILYLVQGRYDDTLQWFEKLFSLKAETDIYCMAKILEAVVHYELFQENADHKFRNNIRILREKKFNKYYVWILKLLHKGLLKHNEVELQHLKVALEEKKNFLGREELLLWLKSRLSKNCIKETFLLTKEGEKE